MTVNRIEIRPYTLKDLAQRYGVCDKTFKKWLRPFLDELGERQGNYYQIPQVRIIFEKLGLPGYIEEE